MKERIKCPKPQKKVSTAPARPGRRTFANDAEKIKSRQTQEIVIALCGFVGSGVSTVSKRLKNAFESYGYLTNEVKISKIIKNKLNITDIPSDKGKCIKQLQDAGLKLRTEHGDDVLASEAVVQIRTNREKLRVRLLNMPDSLAEEIDKALEKLGNSRDDELRTVTIIDNIKHKAELDLLRAIYGDMFFLFGIICPEETRRKRLSLNKRIKDSEASQIIELDRKYQDPDGHGVQVAKVLCEADFFLSNEKEHIKNINPKIARFIELILGINAHSPTRAEFAMCCAEASAMRSACISKQVGACIVTEFGDILSVGRNDVPKFGGGLYTCDDQTNDNRCAFRYNGQCKNDEIKGNIENDIFAKLCEKFENINDSDKEKIAKLVAGMDRIKGITEYSRAIHAEMDAITSAARNGGNGLKNATLYCTTFPCHNCARHIVSSGIKRVYYIEPYDKSLAFDLHDDSIVLDKPEGGDENHLRINQFEGVAPRVYLRLFKADERKAKGRLFDLDPFSAKPKIRKALDTVEYHEDITLKSVNDRHNSPASTGGHSVQTSTPTKPITPIQSDEPELPPGGKSA